MGDALREMTVGTGAGLDTADMVLNIGPQHPATHGVLRLALTLDGERILRADPVIGYMHRGAEKLFEARDYRQIIVLANRHDWLGAFAVYVADLGVEFRTRSGTVRALDSIHLRVESLQLHQPSLDDVFLAKTGRKLEGAGA